MDQIVGAAVDKAPNYRASIDEFYWAEDGISNGIFYAWDKYLNVDWIAFLYNAFFIVSIFMISLTFQMAIYFIDPEKFAAS